MKKIILSLFLVCLVVSCGGKKVKDEQPAVVGDFGDAPEWVMNPDLGIKDGIAGVGIAPASRGGLQFQIPKAETDARANIATRIQSEISRVTKQALREANVNQVNDVEEVFSQATKEVVKDIPLSGVKRVNMAKAKDGTLYIRMVLTKEDYSGFLENSQKVFEARLRQANLSRDNIDKSQKAVQSLFDELEEERKK